MLLFMIRKLLYIIKFSSAGKTLKTHLFLLLGFGFCCVRKQKRRNQGLQAQVKVLSIRNLAPSLGKKCPNYVGTEAYNQYPNECPCQLLLTSCCPAQTQCPGYGCPNYTPSQDATKYLTAQDCQSVAQS